MDEEVVQVRGLVLRVCGRVIDPTSVRLRAQIGRGLLWVFRRL